MMTVFAPAPARFAAMILTALATLAAVMAAATPAGADTSDDRPCVSRGEYRQVHRE